MTLRYVVVGPERHGVVQHALRLAEADPRLAEAMVRVPAEVSGHTPAGLGAAVPAGSTAMLHVTDRLFGSSPEEAASVLRPLARGSRLALSLHDIPQPAEGVDWYRRRRAAYAEFASLAARVMVASEFEKGLLAACLNVDADRARVLSSVAVVPLPIEVDAWPATRGVGSADEIAVLGYLYPGKGVEDVIDAAAVLAGQGIEMTVTNLGSAAEGHEALVTELADRAARVGVRFRVTGYLPDDELSQALSGAVVPVAPHRHISASGSLNRWVAAGRRPIVRRSGYAAEHERRLPGTIVLTDSLVDGIRAALDDAGSTWLADSTRVGPTWAKAAGRHARILERLG